MIFQENHLLRLSGNNISVTTHYKIRIKRLNMAYKLPQEAIKYALLQRTSLTKLCADPRSKFTKKLSRIGLGKSHNDVINDFSIKEHSKIEAYYYKEIKESFDAIKNHIPNYTKSILDIGCGLAGLDIFLHNMLKKNNPEIYLLDKTKVEGKIWYGFEQRGAFYNSLLLAKKNLSLNNIPLKKINIIEAPADGIIKNIKNIDLVTSTISWGFHYPINLYLDSVIKLMSNRGVLIVNIRKETYELEALSDKFKILNIIENTEKYFTIKCEKKDKY